MLFLVANVLTYRPEDENHPSVKPDKTVDNLAHAVDLLLQGHL